LSLHQIKKKVEKNHHQNKKEKSPHKKIKTNSPSLGKAEKRFVSEDNSNFQKEEIKQK